MRVRLLVLAMLCACNEPLIEPLAGGGDSRVELHAFAASPDGDRLATIEWVEGGGAAGYVGYRVRVAVHDTEWRTLAFVRARDVHVTWSANDELAITGSFDDWDRTQNEHTIHAADADGLRVTMRAR